MIQSFCGGAQSAAAFILLKATRPFFFVRIS